MSSGRGLTSRQTLKSGNLVPWKKVGMSEIGVTVLSIVPVKRGKSWGTLYKKELRERTVKRTQGARNQRFRIVKDTLIGTRRIFLSTKYKRRERQPHGKGKGIRFEQRVLSEIETQKKEGERKG